MIAQASVIIYFWWVALSYYGQEKNDRYFPDDIFKCIFVNENQDILTSS